MSSTGSVTKLIRLVKSRNAAAAEELVARYFRRLAGLARARLRGRCLGAADEEDVVQSALAGFLRGAERGQYRRLHDRGDLWHLLVKITTRKALKLVKEQQAQKRHRGQGCEGSPAAGSGDAPHKEIVEQIADPNPPPDLEVLAKEEIEHLLKRLGDAQLQSIAAWKFQDYTNEEIARRLGCTCRTVERKLRLIRTIWRQEAS